MSRILRTLRSYLPVMLLALAAVAVGYAIVGIAAYVFAPSQRVTTQTFRLEFEGAERGEYPNGTKFSSAEIISTPILIKTFEQNDLKRFTSFTQFSRAIFVLESNAAQDALAREYQARLSDIRLTSIDRERIQREYELKLASLDKGQYSINFLRKSGKGDIPEVLARKVLHDVLRNWADFVSNEQHVFEYRIALLSPDVVSGPSADVANPLVATAMLRAKVLRVLENIDALRALPSAELARTQNDKLSLADISVRLEDVVRFRLEPLLTRIAASGIDDRAETLRFLETQLLYDERKLNAQTASTDAQQRTLAMYMNATTSELERTQGSRPAQPAVPRSGTNPAGGGEGETVMPQISDTFIDRLIQLTASTADKEYRQRLAEDYRRDMLKLVPLQQAVAYDQTVIELVRSGGGGGGAAVTRQSLDQTIGASRAEVRQLVVKVHDLYKQISSNLNPSTELITANAPSTRVERGLSLKKVVIYGILTLAIALPLIVFICLLHSRIRQEEEEEEHAPTTDAVEAV